MSVSVEFVRESGAGTGWFSEWIDERLLATYVDRRLTLQSFDQYLQWLENDLSTWPSDKSRAVFYEVPTRSEFGPRFRKALAEVLNRHQEKLKQCTTGYAFVTPSAITRGVLTATFWLAPPGYPTQVFKDSTEAFQWLALSLGYESHSPEATRWLERYLRVRDRIGLSESA